MVEEGQWREMVLLYYDLKKKREEGSRTAKGVGVKGGEGKRRQEKKKLQSEMEGTLKGACEHF